MTTKTKTAAKKAAKKTVRKPAVAKRTSQRGRAPLLGRHPVPVAKTSPAAKSTTPAKKEPRVSMWGTARELITAGKTNADVLAVLRERFGLPEKHNSYPVWYRAYAVTNGIVTREFAKAHAGPPIARKPATA